MQANIEADRAALAEAETEIRKTINEVIAARQSAAALKSAVVERVREFEQANAELLASAAEASLELEEAECRLREYTFQVYSLTGNKKPAPGVSIRVGSKLVYREAVALAWAKEHGLCLALDKKAFEAIAKAQPLDFVDVEETITATIATDLQPIE